MSNRLPSGSCSFRQGLQPLLSVINSLLTRVASFGCLGMSQNTPAREISHLPPTPSSGQLQRDEKPSVEAVSGVVVGRGKSTLNASKELADTKRQVAELLHHIHVLTLQKNQVDVVLKGMLESTSWRLTAPVRRFFEIVRTCRPLVRWRTVLWELVPDGGVEVEGKRIRVTGASPAVLLSPKEGAKIPTGWVFISGAVTAPRYPVFSLLYYRTGTGFDATQRVWLPLSNDRAESTMAFIPPGTQALRFDPFEANACFTLDHLEIKEIGKVQMFAHVAKKHLRGAFSNPRGLLTRLKKGLAIVREGGIAALRARVFTEDHFTHNYQEWVRRYDTITDADRREISAHSETLQYRPRISIVMPTYNPPERWLRAAIESVQRQLYKNWELCIADDCSTDPRVRACLEEYAAKDKRIKVVFRTENGHISKASNSAAELATGEFIGLLDHDDELTEHALYMVVCELNKSSNADLLYSDEDKMTTYGMRFNPYFKSDWNPDLLCCQNYVCHFSVVRTALFRKVGGFRAGFDGAQDWDLILRIADASSPDKIRHIPHVLYHWRVIETSTAHSTSAKPYVMQAQVKSVKEHLERRGVVGAKVEINESISQLRVRYPVPTPQPLVSIIIPTRDQLTLLRRCVEGVLEQTSYRNVELIIVDNGSTDPLALEYLAEMATDPRVEVLRDDKPFNFSRLNNDAVKRATGDILGFLNNDLEVIDPEWLSEMVSHVVRSGVGAVGARLLYPNGLLQHGGIVLGIGGVAGHNHKGRARHDPGYFNRAILCQNLSGVTAACVLVRKSVFEEVRGFEEGALSVAFNDVDLCLKIRKEGYLVVYNPHAELYHHESASRGYETTPEKFARFESEIETMKNRWGETLSTDPYYNPNLTLLTEDFAFAFPPRTAKPWRVAQPKAVAKAA